MISVMKTHVLTPRQKEIMNEFIETGKKLEGFYVVVHRVKNNLPVVEEELKLIKKFSEALAKE